MVPDEMGDEAKGLIPLFFCSSPVHMLPIYPKAGIIGLRKV
jgi:hypothetical protein